MLPLGLTWDTRHSWSKGKKKWRNVSENSTGSASLLFFGLFSREKWAKPRFLCWNVVTVATAFEALCWILIECLDSRDSVIKNFPVALYFVVTYFLCVCIHLWVSVPSCGCVGPAVCCRSLIIWWFPGIILRLTGLVRALHLLSHCWPDYSSWKKKNSKLRQAKVISFCFSVFTIDS